MKPRNIFLPLFTLVLAAFLFSCAGSHPNARMLVGNWQPVQAEKYIPENAVKKSPKEKVQPVDTSQSAKNIQPAMTKAQEAEKELEAQWGHMVEVEKKTPLVVRENFLAEKQYKSRLVRGTWKLKKQGTRIVFKEEVTGETLKAEILEISDSSMVMVEHSPVGDIKVKYRKK